MKQVTRDNYWVRHAQHSSYLCNNTGHMNLSKKSNKCECSIFVWRFLPLHLLVHNYIGGGGGGGGGDDDDDVLAYRTREN